jgi:hypothetical protein
VIKTPEERADAIILNAYGDVVSGRARDYSALQRAIADVIRATEADIARAAAAEAEEREACAKLAERYGDHVPGEGGVTCFHIAKAIRGRG